MRRWEQSGAARQTLEALQRSMELVESLSTNLTMTLRLSLPTLTGKPDLTNVPLAKWSQHVDQWQTAREQINRWKLYRVWSTDWFQSQDEQLRKLIAFIEDARSATVFQTINEPEAQSATSPSASTPATDETTIDREDSGTSDSKQPAESD